MNKNINKDNLYRRQKGREYLQQYLDELNSLLKIEGERVNILSIEESDDIKKKGTKNIDKKISIKFKIPFSNKEKALNECISKCSKYSERGYLFTDYSNYCGAVLMDSLYMLRTNFKFSAEHAGIINILSSDFSNCMILDFYDQDNLGKILEIELKGILWANINLSLDYIAS